MTILLETLRHDGDQESVYYVKGPDGKVKRHLRASSYTGLIDDDYALRRYDDRMLAHGVGRRKDLAQMARNHDPHTDRDTYHQTIIPQARIAAESDAKANTGTALHMDTVHLDRGAQVAALDPDWHTHHRAYQTCINALPFTVHPDHIERTVILDGHRIAGTIDRVLTATSDLTVIFPNKRRIQIAAGDMIIGDLKTGRWGLEYNQIKWPMQCAIYANHTATWHPDPSDDPELGERGPVIGVRPDVALVIHLQASDPAAACAVHWLDLEAGYDSFLSAVEVKGHRAAARHAHCQFVDYLPSQFEAITEQWARARIGNLTGPALDDLKRLWPLRDPDTGHVIRYENPTPEQTTALLDVLSRVEAQHQIPFVAPPATDRQPTTANGTKETTNAHHP